MQDKEKPRTEQDLIEEARKVQDACNLSGVVHSFSRALTALRAINSDTTWLNTHQVSRLYASKIQSLSGDVILGDF